MKKSAHDVHNSASLIADAFHFLGWEIRNKSREKGIGPETDMETLLGNQKLHLDPNQ